MALATRRISHTATSDVTTPACGGRIRSITTQKVDGNLSLEKNSTRRYIKINSNYTHGDSGFLIYFDHHNSVRFPMGSLKLFIDFILQPHSGPGIDSDSNRNECQEHFLRGGGGVKAAAA
jgi:hypothetical protein